MNREPHAAADDLCAAIEVAIRLAEALDDTLVSALLAEANDAARCEERRTAPE